MFFELRNGSLYEIPGSIGKNPLSDLGNFYIDQVNDSFSTIIDSYNDRCYIVPVDAVRYGIDDLFKNEISKKIIDTSYENSEYKNVTTFILAITYACNFKCSYCYQQYNNQLKRTVISDDNLMYIFDIISTYMKKYPNKEIELGLFGGEPLLPQNEDVINKIIDFCKKERIQFHIATNGFYLPFFMKKFIINRNFISSIGMTIDSLELISSTRISVSRQEKYSSNTEQLIKSIKTLIFYGINVHVETNLDLHNYRDIRKIEASFRENGLLDNPNFHWFLGRVDDRLYETNYPDIIPEYFITNELFKNKLSNNIHSAYLKTTLNLTKKLGFDPHQSELVSRNSYCFASSDLDNVFYIDNDLKTYRCTYTVGRPEFSIFDFSMQNLENYTPHSITSSSYKECSSCSIGGYCGGGCQLSHHANFTKCCSYEKQSFSGFIKEVFNPKLNELLRNYNDEN